VNYPRGIETAVNWVTDFLQYLWKNGYVREEATPEAEQRWHGYIIKLYNFMLLREAQGWFTGYNSNVDGHEKGTRRYFMYNGGAVRYRKILTEVADDDYAGLTLT
jgi:hypothetical protein